MWDVDRESYFRWQGREKKRWCITKRVCAAFFFQKEDCQVGSGRFIQKGCRGREVDWGGEGTLATHPSLRLRKY